MSTDLAESGPQLSEKDLAAFEGHTARPIPAAYRDFLLRHNGGYPEVSDFEIPGHDEDDPTLMGTVDRFLGIRMDSEYANIDRYLKVYRERVPEEYYPIATDPGGNLIVMKTGEPGAGSIYFWDHEEEAEQGQPPTEDNLYKVADSLNDFLSRLQ